MGEPGVRSGGLCDWCRAGTATADLPDHAYWEQWFPADWVSEMREQIRLWFYSISFMSVTLTGALLTGVLTYEKLLDETGREMHRSWGNSIEVNEALDRMGADVMRWQYCSQPPTQNLLFGFGPGHEIQRRLLTLWNSAKFLVDYASIEGWAPTWSDLTGGLGRSPSARPLARVPHERARARSDRGLRELADGRRRPCLRGLHRGRVELVHPPVETPILGRRGGGVADALVRARPGPPRRRAAHAVPRRPSLAGADRTCRRGPESIHLAGWPDVTTPDSALLDEVAELRRVVELGRQARPRGVKLRQPLRALVVAGAAAAEGHADEIAEELRVKEVSFGDVEASELRVSRTSGAWAEARP